MGKKYKGTKAAAAPKFDIDYVSDGTYISDEDEYSGMYHEQQQQHIPDYYYPQIHQHQSGHKSDYYNNNNMSSGNKHKGNHNKEPAYKMNKYQTIVLKVQVHCDACLKKVKKAAANIDGVESINVDVRLKRVSITGYIDPKKVLKKVAKTGKQIELVGASSNVINTNNMMYNAYNSNFMNPNAKSLILPFDTNIDHVITSHNNNSNKGRHNHTNINTSNLINTNNMLMANSSSNSNKSKQQQHVGMNNINHHHNSNNNGANMMNFNTARMLVLQNPNQARNEVDHIFSDDNVNNCSIM